MTVLRTISASDEIRDLVDGWRDAGHRIGFVPTMGALHEGHMSLVELAMEACDRVIVSIFVNPTQFGPDEDLEQYPRPVERDVRKLEAAGAHCVFLPEACEIYPAGHSTTVAVSGLTENLCGRFRKGHFDGVTTVCTILFDIVRPDVAVFGRKDAQQLTVIRRMVKDLHIDVSILAGDIVREPDGLALSSRNSYLTDEQREQAASIFRGLQRAESLVSGGETDPAVIMAEARRIIETASLAEIQYLELVDPDTIQPVHSLIPHALLAVAVYFGNTRLIDNIVLEPPGD